MLKLPLPAKAACFALGLSFVAGQAAAVPIAYAVNGSFNGAGEGGYSGSFVYDADTGFYSAINIVTTAGTVVGPNTFTASSGFNSAAQIRVTSNPGNPAAGRCLVLSLDNTLTNAGAARTVSSIYDYTNFGAANCDSFDNGAPLRQGTSGTVAKAASTPTPAPVPTMTEWAMILLGMLLAGVAALTIQRRRAA